MEIFSMWQFWTALVSMAIIWKIIKHAAGLQSVTILRAIANRLWAWQRKLLHAALVTEYAADVSAKISQYNLTTRAEGLAKQTIIMSVDPILLDESEKTPARS